MQPFTQLTGIAAALPLVNVDTDKIIPGLYLKTITRSGLGRVLLEELRYLPSGAENPEFILNRGAYRKAGILIAGENFGCGSSREHAPWALLDFGIRCIIAPSFADIFYGNCIKNGMLPITLPNTLVKELSEIAIRTEGGPFAIDLAQQIISAPGREPIAFAIEPFQKRCLLEGLSDVHLTLQHERAITDFETRHFDLHPWLHA